MQFNLDTAADSYLIRAYEPGRIQVNDHWFTHSIIISPQQLIKLWQPESLADLKSSDFDAMLALTPEVVLLGTGIKLNFPVTELLAAFYENQIGVEIMDTGAACRTYNVLVSEGRKVVAGLLIK